MTVSSGSVRTVNMDGEIHHHHHHHQSHHDHYYCCCFIATVTPAWLLGSRRRPVLTRRRLSTSTWSSTPGPVARYVCLYQSQNQIKFLKIAKIYIIIFRLTAAVPELSMLAVTLTRAAEGLLPSPPPSPPQLWASP